MHAVPHWHNLSVAAGAVVSLSEIWGRQTTFSTFAQLWPPAASVGVALNLSGCRTVPTMTASRWTAAWRPGEEAVVMKKGLLIGVGALIALVGIVFMLQGLGAIGGSAMSGSTFWAVVGPVIALVGLAVAGIGMRRRSVS